MTDMTQRAFEEDTCGQSSTARSRLKVPAPSPRSAPESKASSGRCTTSCSLRRSTTTPSSPTRSRSPAPTWPPGRPAPPPPAPPAPPLADAEQVPGPDVAAWQACLATSGPASRVAEDVALATNLGIDATPAFIVNGVPVVGAVPESDVR